MKRLPFLRVCNAYVMTILAVGCVSCSAEISNGDYNATGGQPATAQSTNGGKNSTGGQSPSSDAGNGVQSQCAWPKEFNITNPLGGGCMAERPIVLCENSNDSSVSCASDDPTQCPDSGLEPAATHSNCVNQCTSDEYVLACGSVSPGYPPSTCRFFELVPAGVIYFCCPCGT
jgi:hypothetical protein